MKSSYISSIRRAISSGGINRATITDLQGSVYNDSEIAFTLTDYLKKVISNFERGIKKYPEDLQRLNKAKLGYKVDLNILEQYGLNKMKQSLKF